MLFHSPATEPASPLRGVEKLEAVGVKRRQGHFVQGFNHREGTLVVDRAKELVHETVSELVAVGSD
jgi:hypothetical protein